MYIESYDQHIEDASPQWPVAYGVFENVALQLMSEEVKQCYGKNLFAVWLYFHFHPDIRWNADKMWDRMKRDLKRKQNESTTTSKVSSII